MRASRICPSNLSAQTRLPAAQSWPQPFAIDEHPPVSNHLGEERWLGFCVLEANDINAPTRSCGEFGTELDDPIEAWIAKSNEHVDITPWRVGTSRCGPEQQSEANVGFRTQRCS